MLRGLPFSLRTTTLQRVLVAQEFLRATASVSATLCHCLEPSESFLRTARVLYGPQLVFPIALIVLLWSLRFTPRPVSPKHFISLYSRYTSVDHRSPCKPSSFYFYLGCGWLRLAHASLGPLLPSRELEPYQVEPTAGGSNPLVYHSQDLLSLPGFRLRRPPASRLVFRLRAPSVLTVSARPVPDSFRITPFSRPISSPLQSAALRAADNGGPA